MKKIIAIGLLASSLISCSNNALTPYSTAEGTWSGTVMYLNCFPGQKGSVTFTFTAPNDSGQFSGIVKGVSGQLSLDAKFDARGVQNFTATVVGQSANNESSFSMRRDSNLLIGTYSQQNPSNCTNGTTGFANANVSAQKQ